MQITTYVGQHRSLWSNFIDRSVNGTCFHRQEFLDYHPPDRFDWHHLILGNLEHPAAVLPASIIVSEEGRKIFQSPTGATLGGPALRPQLGIKSTMDMVQSLIDYVSGLGLDGITLGTVPSVYWRGADDTLEFALRNAGFASRSQLMYYVDLTSLSQKDIMQSFPARRRSDFRKALRQGMTFTLAEDADTIAQFFEVLVVNKAMHRASPVHSVEEIQTLKRILGERLQLFCAKVNSEIVCGVYCVTENDRACYTQYIADLPDRRELEAVRFVLFHMLKYLREKKVAVLDFGPSLQLPIQSVTGARFKESVGALGHERRCWSLEF